MFSPCMLELGIPLLPLREVMCMPAEFTIDGIAVPEFPLLVRLYMPVDMGETFCPGFHCVECTPPGLELPKGVMPEAPGGVPIMLMEVVILVPSGYVTCPPD